MLQGNMAWPPAVKRDIRVKTCSRPDVGVSPFDLRGGGRYLMNRYFIQIPIADDPYSAAFFDQVCFTKTCRPDYVYNVHHEVWRYYLLDWFMHCRPVPRPLSLQAFLSSLECPKFDQINSLSINATYCQYTVVPVGSHFKYMYIYIYIYIYI